MAKRKNKDIDVLYGIFDKLERNLCEEEIGFLKSCIRKSFLTKRKIEEWMNNSISYGKKRKENTNTMFSFLITAKLFGMSLHFYISYQITTIMFPLEICKKRYWTSNSNHYVFTWNITERYVSSWQIDNIMFWIYMFPLDKYKTSNIK